MKMLDLFCGTKSISNVFKDAGHEVFTLDFKSKFEPDLCIDILDFDVSMLPWIPDVIWASPDCRTWSIASCYHHWNKDKTPKTKACKNGIKVLNKTLDLIEEINSKYHFLENPVDLMRKNSRMIKWTQKYFRHTVTYCKYGDNRMKPTDIWTNNSNWHPKPKCKAKRKGIIVNCNHQIAKRGSKTGTQGLKCDIERSRIPKLLCKEILNACELK